MSLDELKPFLKIGAAVIAIALFGLYLTCSFGSKPATPTDACKDLKMDKINLCIDRMRACSGDEEAAKACHQKVVSELK